jgi:hypothetical protein
MSVSELLSSGRLDDQESLSSHSSYSLNVLLNRILDPGVIRSPESLLSPRAKTQWAVAHHKSQGGVDFVVSLVGEE